MITITKVSKPTSKTINVGDIHVDRWYPIHVRDEAGDLLGFVRYLGGSSAAGFMSTLNGDYPCVTTREAVENALDNTNGVVIDKFVNLTFNIEAQEHTSKFVSVQMNGLFSLNGETYIKVSDRLAVKHDTDGKPLIIGTKVDVKPLARVGNTPLSIKYSE